MANKRIVLIVIVVAAACVIGACALDRYVLAQTYARVPAREASLLPTYALYEKSYPRADEEFQIEGATLRGHVYGPDNTRGLVIFRHGIFSQHQDYLPLIIGLVDKGWRVFAYDALGCGESDGDTVRGMSQSPLDVEEAVNFAHQSGLAGDGPLMLVGHSWGGYGVAAALEACPDIDACVTMSGFDTPLKVLTASAENSFGIIGRLQEPFLWANTLLDFGANGNRSASEAVLASGVPTLVIHGSGDTVVPYDGVSILAGLAAHSSATPNADIELITKDEPGRNGHNDYFYAPESQAYLNERAALLQHALDDADGDATAAEVQEIMAETDLLKANTADPALIDQIDSFLAAHAR